MLKSIELQEKYKVIGGEAFAVIEETGAKRAVNGCETRVELNAEYAELSAKKTELENKLEAVTSKMTENKRLDNTLAAAGFCLIDNPVYKKIDGIIVVGSDGKAVVDKYTHAPECAHKTK